MQPRPGEPAFHGLYPPTGLPRSYEEQLVQLSAHAAAQEHMQRQLMERERLGMPPLGHAVPTSMHSIHPSLLAQHQQEYLRMQRERDKR